MAAARVRARPGHVGFVVEKVALGQVFSECCPCQFSILIIIRGSYNRPIGGRRAKWTQLDSTPPLFQFKKKLAWWILGFWWLRNLYVTDVPMNLFIRICYMNFMSQIETIYV
jgi:hypothetical protein